MNRKAVIRTALTILSILCLVSCKTADVDMGIQVEQYQAQIESMQSQMEEMLSQIAQLQDQVKELTQEAKSENESEETNTTEAIEASATQEPETVPAADNTTESTTETTETVEEIQDLPFWEIGQIGPFGGLVFQFDGKCYEIAEPLYETSSYEDAKAYCNSLTPDSENANQYRLPTVDELLAIYDQLVMTELSEIDWTYYWSCEEIDETSASIVNFDTGFDGKFYKSMDFVSALPVCEL